MGMRTYEKKEYNVMNDIIVEMNSSLIQIERKGYTFLDVLSDIGGIQGILFIFMLKFIRKWNYNHFDNYVTSKLFKIVGENKS